MNDQIAGLRHLVVRALVRLAAAIDAEPDLFLVANTERLPNRPGTPRAGVVEPFLIADPGGLPLAIPADHADAWRGRLVPAPRGMKVTKVFGDEGSPLRGFGRRGSTTSLGQRGYCTACEMVVPDGPDACLGLLPGVAQACCGHGDPERAYVVIGGEPGQDVRTIESPVRLAGADALDYFEQQGRTCPKS